MFMDDLKVSKYWYERGMNIFWTCGETGALGAGLKQIANGIAEF